MKVTMMDAALKYAEANIPVIPLHWICEGGSCSCKAGKNCDSKGKHPLYTGWYKNSTSDIEQIRKWWTKTPNANIGIPTGEKSGWLVLDVDDGGNETLSALEATHGKLPDTVTAVTGSGGRHYIFKYPKGRSIPNKTKFAPGLDTRSTGGLIVVAPSIHVSGNRYEWIKDHSPFDRTPAEAPAWLLKLMEREEVLLTPFEGSSIIAEIKEGSRNSTLTSLAGTMRARGMTEEGIYAALLAENNARCNPPLDEAEVRKIAHSVSRYQPNPPVKKYYHRTDSGNAERLRDRFGSIIRYCPAFKYWLVYDGCCWRKETGELTQFAIKTARDMLTEASRIEDEAARKELVRHAMQSENAGRLKAMIDVASNLEGLIIMPDELDADIWKLNCKNGVVDLKTGELLPHKREYYMSKICPVEYKPSSKAPRWMDFLNTITGGSNELVRYLQKAVGSSLSGDISEQALFVLYGTGANGKSTFLNTISDLLGDYARNTPSETFMAKRIEAIGNDIARLQGARLVTAIEINEGQRLSEALIKSFTGGDRITARFLYGEYFDFQPQFTPFLVVNHRPVIRDTSHSIWRRIKLIPFTVTIPEDKKDKQLPAKLREELPGILSWAVEGCLLWQKEGLNMPDEVKTATEGYREEMDTFSSFIEECCIVEEGRKVSNRSIRYAYETWCRENGDYPLGQKLFNAKMTERGFAVKRSGANGSRDWHGIGLADEGILL